MKMPVGEKKKRKDKDGEKVSTKNQKYFDNSGLIDLQIDKTRENQVKMQHFFSDLPRPLALLLCCVQYSKENRRARGRFFFFRQSTMLHFQLFRSSTLSVDEIRNVEM